MIRITAIVILNLIQDLFIFLLIASPVSAVTVTISNVPSSVTDQAFSFNVSVSGASAGTNYLRMDLYKDTTTNYFGETYNNTSWYSGSDGKQYFPITIVSGQTWNGLVQGRLRNPSSTEYPESGAYKIKMRRYTSSGSLASSDTQTPQDITINFSSPSPSSSSSSPSPSPSSSTTSSSFTISGVTAEIQSDQSFSVSVNINLPSNPNTTFYLKGAFKKLDSSNYFGQTKVGSSWVKNGSGFENQYKITTNQSGNWSGNLEVQPDILDSGYDGAGAYLFKVGKYSSGGALTWSNEINIQIAANEVATEPTGDFPKVSPNIKTDTKNNLPDEVYSLENYRKSSSVAAVQTEAISSTQIAGEKFKNPFLILGGALIFLGISSTCFILFKRWKNT